MNFLALLTQNFWVLVALLLFIITIVSIVLGILLEAYKARIKSRQKILELRNEELRLRLKLEQQKKDTPDRPAARGFALPKESPWDEQPQAHYEVGYQQQQQ